MQELGSDNDNLDLEPVDSGRLEILDVNKTCSLRDFVEKTHQLVPYNPRRFFFEFTCDKEDITDDKEIILMDKVSTNKCMDNYIQHDYDLGHKTNVYGFKS
jgi:hypothetical protein